MIVPARNEQHRLGECLAALAADPVAADVVVVDDESTDATAAVARKHGVRVIAAGRRPEGWAGKTWALQCGLSAVTGDWVVALDADTRVPSRPHRRRGVSGRGLAGRSAERGRTVRLLRGRRTLAASGDALHARLPVRTSRHTSRAEGESGAGQRAVHGDASPVVPRPRRVPTRCGQPDRGCRTGPLPRRRGRRGAVRRRDEPARRGRLRLGVDPVDRMGSITGAGRGDASRVAGRGPRPPLVDRRRAAAEDPVRSR